jgi:hypothetical protein
MPLSLSDTSPPGGMKETFMRRITITSSTLIGVAEGPTFLKGAYMAKVHGGKKLERRGGGGGGVLFHPPHTFLHTAKTKYRNFESNSPRKGISGSQSQFPHDLYFPTIGLPLFCWRKYVDRSWDYINRSQTHECGNRAWGRAIYRKGIISGIFVAVLHASGQIFLLTTWTVFLHLGYLLHHLGPIEYRRDGLGPSCQFGTWLGASFP